MEVNNKIMIVDDNIIDQMITARVVKSSYGVEEVIVMKSAAEGLDYLHQHVLSPHLLPNLILLDLDMPIMNGFDFLQEFNKCADVVIERCQIVVVTASDVLADLEIIQSHPRVLKLIPKPLAINSLSPIM